MDVVDATRDSLSWLELDDFMVTTVTPDIDDHADNVTLDQNGTLLTAIPHLPALNAKQLSVTVLHLSFCPLVFVGNLLILMAIRKSKSMKQVTFLFLGHLAMSDVLLGFSFFMRAFFLLQKNLSKFPCIIVHWFTLVSSGCSMTGICFLSLDSFLSVKFSMQLRPIITQGIAWAMIVMCWLIWSVYYSCLAGQAILDSLPLAPCFLGGGYYSKKMLLSLPLIYLLHLLIVVYLQVVTINMVKKHFKQLDTARSGPSERNDNIKRRTSTLPRLLLRSSVVPSVSGHVDNTMDPGNSRPPTEHVVVDNQREKRLKKITSMNRIVGLVLLSFFICWFPSMSLLLLFSICPDGCGVPSDIMLVSATLIIVSAMTNVCVYATKSPEFRVMFRSFLRLGRCQNHVYPEDNAPTG